jgi:hypothetical protein
MTDAGLVLHKLLRLQAQVRLVAPDVRRTF